MGHCLNLTPQLSICHFEQGSAMLKCCILYGLSGAWEALGIPLYGAIWPEAEMIKTKLCDYWCIIHGLGLDTMPVVKQSRLNLLLHLERFFAYTDIKHSQLWKNAAFLALDKMARHIKLALQPLIDNGNKSCQSFRNSSSSSQVTLWMRAGTDPCLSNISDTVSCFLARTLTDSGRRPRYITPLLFQSWLCFAFNKTLLALLRVGEKKNLPLLLIFPSHWELKVMSGMLLSGTFWDGMLDTW